MQRIIYTRLIQRERRFLVRCAIINYLERTTSSEAPYTTENNRNSENRSRKTALIGLLGVGAGLALLFKNVNYADAASIEPKPNVEEYGQPKKGLPLYNMDDVAKHSSMKDRVWISYSHGVYDITDYIHEHPGGDQILIGAGSSVEPFWSLYAVHKNPHVLKILEKYRIGNLVEDEVGSTVKDMEDPYAGEPKRHLLLEPSSKQPFNAWPPVSLLTENLLTPKELFYVRNHLPVPEVDPLTYELEVRGLGMKEKQFTLDDLKKFPKYTVTITIQCGGNRRSEMMKVKKVKGLLSCGQTAISNAEWTGVRLRDVLLSAGIDASDDKIQHVQFEGLDIDPMSNPYGASIPIEKAMSATGDVLLAYEMNGEPLSRDHGFPLRVVVPGTVGARCVKWLGRIVVSEQESPSHWQQNDYKGFAPNIDWDTVDFSKSPAIQDLPVTSAFCIPADGDTVKLKNGKMKLQGYAYSGGGRKIIRVDVSVDGGQNWQEVDQYTSDSSKHPRSWGWTLWSSMIEIDKSKKEAEIVVKAVDSSYNSQPGDFSCIWNLRGLLCNAYHRVKVKISS